MDGMKWCLSNAHIIAWFTSFEIVKDNAKVKIMSPQKNFKPLVSRRYFVHAYRRPKVQSSTS